MTFQKGLTQLMDGDTLSRISARHMMDHIMSGEATPSQIAAFLTVLRFRGETIDELTGFAESLRHHADQLNLGDVDVLDTCGTGGDGASTFNISTAVAILISAMGVNVAKHGNRAVSSKSGSADVLEALGISIPQNKSKAIEDLKSYGMCFLYAPEYHASLKHAAMTRKELGFRTVFNLLGPLANPAGSHRQLLGVYDYRSATKMAQALCHLGTEKALLVTGDNGLDEVSITGATQMLYVTGNTVTPMTIEPEDVGLERGVLSEIQVSGIEESATLIETIFAGKANKSATNIVLFNAAAALFVADKVRTIAEGVHEAQKALYSGKGLQQLNLLRSIEDKEVRHA